MGIFNIIKFHPLHFQMDLVLENLQPIFYLVLKIFRNCHHTESIDDPLHY
jgi:hypothetical protein